jgi:hypothetical protein
MTGRVTQWPRQPLLNVWADDLSMDDLLARLATTGGVLFTVNPDHLYHLQYNPNSCAPTVRPTSSPSTATTCASRCARRAARWRTA